jgi:hypothetical protein
MSGPRGPDQTNKPRPLSGSTVPGRGKTENQFTSVTVTHHRKIHHGNAHEHQSLNETRFIAIPHPRSNPMHELLPAHTENTRAPPTYPFHPLCCCQRTGTVQAANTRDTLNFVCPAEQVIGADRQT